MFSILAKDDLNVSFRFPAVISIDPGQVRQVVEKFGGEEWYKRYIRATFRTYVRDAAQRYDSVDLKSKRDLLTQVIKHKMSNYVEATPFNLINLIVGNIDYPDVVARAVEKKLAGQQLLAE